MSTLADVLAGFDAAPAANEYDPLPPGEYAATVVKGELAEARTGTPSFKLTFQVDDGPHAGRLVFHDLWLTPKAMGHTKRDLLKVGVTAADQLERPLPARFRCRVRLTRQRSDTGNVFNRVKRFDVVERVEDRPDPFAPAAGGAA